MNNNNSNKLNLHNFANYLFLIFCSLIFLTPLLFMISASFKNDQEVLSITNFINIFIPNHFTISNYKTIFRELNFFNFLFNSIFIVGTIVTVGLAVNSAAGFALSRLKWHGKEIVLTLVIIILVIPYEAVAIPLFFEIVTFGWINSYIAQIIPFIANPFSIYLFYTFFNSLPKDLDEAAIIDKANPFQIYFHIAIPLAKPAFASVAILSFLMHWGFFLWPLMVTRGPQFQPLPVALGYFSSNKPVQWGDIMAFGTMMISPVLIIFLIFQKWFVKGIAMTGVKG